MPPQSKMFDFIVGNVPWDKEIDKIFLQKCKNDLLSDTGKMALITSASYLRGGSNSNKELRSSFLSGNVKKISTYPGSAFISPVTNKPIKGIGACIFFANGESQKETELIRYFGTTALHTTTVFTTSNGTILYLGEEGKQLWNICTVGQKRMPLVPYQPSTKPKIHFNSKLDINYIGGSKPLEFLTGSKLLTGVKLDLDGSVVWIPDLKNGTHTDNAAKRYMLTFDDEFQAVNAYYHFKMRIFGLLLCMTTTISHVNRQSLGSMPYDILTGKAYRSQEEYERAYYKSKNLSIELIEWVRTVGSDHYNTINLKNDLIVSEIKRSSERVKITGEIFTSHQHTADIIADLAEAGLCDSDKITLEPTCGDGNFILAIIKEKLRCGQSPKEALETTFGIDLMEDNVKLCHRRLLELVGDTVENRRIVQHNIVCADFLTGWDFSTWTRIDNNMLIF